MDNVTQGRVQRKFSEVDACHYVYYTWRKKYTKHSSWACGINLCVDSSFEMGAHIIILTAVESLGMGSVEFSTIWVNVISLPKRRCKVQILIICTQTCRIDRITILTELGMRKHHWSEMKLKQYSRWQKINNCLLKWEYATEPCVPLRPYIKANLAVNYV